jgi:hypothetical protein
MQKGNQNYLICFASSQYLRKICKIKLKIILFCIYQALRCTERLIYILPVSKEIKIFW